MPYNITTSNAIPVNNIIKDVRAPDDLKVVSWPYNRQLPMNLGVDDFVYQSPFRRDVVVWVIDSGLDIDHNVGIARPVALRGN